jgi:hypothetical protein
MITTAAPDTAMTAFRRLLIVIRLNIEVPLRTRIAWLMKRGDPSELCSFQLDCGVD